MLLPFLCASIATCLPAQEVLQQSRVEDFGNHNVSTQLFAELEEFARIVDIAYCVGVTGIYPPFECASRCSEFPGYQLVDVRSPIPPLLYFPCPFYSYSD